MAEAQERKCFTCVRCGRVVADPAEKCPPGWYPLHAPVGAWFCLVCVVMVRTHAALSVQQLLDKLGWRVY